MKSWKIITIIIIINNNNKSLLLRINEHQTFCRVSDVKRLDVLNSIKTVDIMT